MSVRARWSLRNIYLYLVCLITLIMVIVSIVGIVRNGVELLYPDPGAYYDRIPVQTDEAGEPIDEAALAEQEQAARDSERRWTVLDLVGNAAMLLVAGPIYLYHWRKIETEPEPEETASLAATPGGGA